MDIRYICDGINEYVLINCKKYNCLKKAKEYVRKNYGAHGRAYPEGMEYLAWQVFVKCSIKNEDLFSEEDMSNK